MSLAAYSRCVIYRVYCNNIRNTIFFLNIASYLFKKFMHLLFVRIHRHEY